MPKNRMLKVPAAAAAAAVGVLFAISSVGAHSTPATTSRSVTPAALSSAVAGNVPLFVHNPATNALTNEEQQDAIEAAARAAALAALLKQKAALKQAALTPCQTAERAEDVAEWKAEIQEAKAEFAAGKPADPAEDAAEKAAETIEDAAETPCPRPPDIDPDPTWQKPATPTTYTTSWWKK